MQGNAVISDVLGSLRQAPTYEFGHLLRAPLQATPPSKGQSSCSQLLANHQGHQFIASKYSISIDYKLKLRKGHNYVVNSIIQQKSATKKTIPVEIMFSFFGQRDLLRNQSPKTAHPAIPHSPSPTTVHCMCRE